jgi:hypothetical protein
MKRKILLLLPGAIILFGLAVLFSSIHQPKKSAVNPLTGASEISQLAQKQEEADKLPIETPEYQENFANAKQIVEQDGDELMDNDPNIQSFGVNADNSLLIRIFGDSEDDIAETTKDYVEKSSIPVAYEFTTDKIGLLDIADTAKVFIGGNGFLFSGSNKLYFCSMGFPAVNLADEKIILTAGHCLEESLGAAGPTYMYGLNPSEQPAAGGSQSTFTSYEIAQADAWILGGVGQNSGDSKLSSCYPSYNMTCLKTFRSDIGAYKVISSQTGNWQFLPRVTRWNSSQAAVNDLFSDSMLVSTIDHPVVGQAVMRSGRTTGYRTGVVTSQYTLIQVSVNASGTDVRRIPAFATSACADSGDSGGSFVQQNDNGDYVGVGLLSAGVLGSSCTSPSYAIDIIDALDLLKNELNQTYRAIVEPPEANQINVVDGDINAIISGKAEPDSTVAVSPAGNSSFSKFTIAADHQGNWSFNYSAKMASDTEFSLSSETNYTESIDSEIFIVDVAPAPPPVLNDGIYTISTALAANRSLDVSNAGTSNGTNIQLWASNSTNAQKWQVLRTKDGFYIIKNILSGSTIDLSNAKTANGANIQLYSPNSTCAQKWQIEPLENDNWKISSACSAAYVIDVSAANSTIGTNVQIWQSNGTNAQKWRFNKLESAVVADGTYYLFSSLNQNFALDVSGASKNNGANVQIYQQNNTVAQKWQIKRGSDGFYRLINPNSGKFLDVDGGGITSGTNVKIWENYDENNLAQAWEIKNAGGSFYTLTNLRSNKNLDVSGANVFNGSNVQIWENNGTNAQKWRLKPL